MHWIGLKVTYQDALIMLHITGYHHNISPVHVVFLKAQSLLHCFSLFISMICVDCASILHLYYLQMLQISQWLKVNKLSFNVKNTNYMLFTKSRNIPLKLNIVIDTGSIGEVRRTKFLGVFIDNKLNWKDHIPYISGKISRGIGMIIEARNYLNQDGLLALYYAFIYPYFTHCNHVWGATYKSNLQRLVIHQNTTVRIISM